MVNPSTHQNNLKKKEKKKSNTNWGWGGNPQQHNPPTGGNPNNGNQN
jgi:hypothetical protein